MGAGFNELYGDWIKVYQPPEVWEMKFSWKRRKSFTSGDEIFLEYAYKKNGSDQWLSRVDYIIYRLKQD